MHSLEHVRVIAIAAMESLTAFGMVPTHAEETTCFDTLGGITVDNLRVPSGSTCTLNATRVNGTVKVERNARLYARRVHVIGNVEAENAKRVSVMANSSVGGSIQIRQGGAATINHVTVTGDIQLESNNRALSALDNSIGGNLRVLQNGGGVRIAYNVIDGSLQCKENDPPPTGGSNVVRGSKEDQCSGL